MQVAIVLLAVVAVASAATYGSSYKPVAYSAPATYSAPAYKQEYSVSNHSIEQYERVKTN
jgi:hypothetical protein